jgi:SAM-dependent methyltransferase
LVPAGGRVCDLGCGPGHLAEHLAGLGLDAFGIDLSAEMVRVARQRFTGLEFRVGDMCRLDLEPASLAGIAAFYSIIHLEPADLARALFSMHRVLMPDGALLLAFHAGEGTVSSDDWFGRGVSISANLLDPADVRRALAEAGFRSVDSLVREPYEQEYPTQRAYELATRSG